MGTSSFFDYDKMLCRIPRPQARKKLRLSIAATGAWRLTPRAPRVPQPPRAARHEAECDLLKKEAEPFLKLLLLVFEQALEARG